MSYRNIALTEGVLRIFIVKRPEGAEVTLEVQDWQRFEEILMTAKEGGKSVFEDNFIQRNKVTFRNGDQGVKNV